LLLLMSGPDYERVGSRAVPWGAGAGADVVLPYIRERKQFGQRSEPFETDCRARSPTCTPLNASRAYV